jgi:hypothetical protein
LRAIWEGNSCLLSPGAPDSPVHHRTLSDADLLPYLAKPTVGSLGAVGAPDTVRCVGAKAKTPPFARSLRCSHWFDRQNRQGHPSLDRHQTKTGNEVIPQCGLVQLGGPRAIRPIVTGPTWPPRVTGLICKGIPVITVCNPALWEYSGDNLGS